MDEASSRRDFLRRGAQATGAAAALSVFPPSILKALAVPANVQTGTIKDVKHVVILMQENRSFGHYFGTMRGVRGFGDRFPVPLASGKSAWFQSDGTREIPPYHMDKEKVNALLLPSTPHAFADAQAAWNQGKLGFWPQHKTPYSMGYYTRDDIPFQFALAEAFTICDAYHCSVTTGTDPNRIVFWSGSNFNPELAAQGINCTDADAEPNNLRCWITGALPEPGYTYQGSAFRWQTLPDVLQEAGVSWGFYQDPNDNWTGAMHGGLAFESFRSAEPGSPLYENGMTHRSIEQLAADVQDDALPQVSWVLPSRIQSEHPGAPSSPYHGGHFTTQVLDALTANPEVWAQTVFFLTFDENDGLFDHVPAPAPPSYNEDGSLAGKATLGLDGEYFSDPDRKYLKADDTISGTVRPYGLGPRVPMYVVSPWSKGGWVSSEVFDHTSVGRFLEQRFDVTVPAISPWHRAVCGDLTTAFDFKAPNDAPFPDLPDMSDYEAVEAWQRTLPSAEPPAEPQPLHQELGVRYSRALPYRLHTEARIDAAGTELSLTFRNTGDVGAVFHVYDLHHLDRIPRRYTVEAGKDLTDQWDLGADDGDYALQVYAPNGFFRLFQGNARGPAEPEIEVRPDGRRGDVVVSVSNPGPTDTRVRFVANAYLRGGPWSLEVKAGGQAERRWSLGSSGLWYDLTLTADGAASYERRFAGRVESGEDGVSDPAFGLPDRRKVPR